MEDLARGEVARRKGDRSGRYRFDGERRGASGGRRRSYPEFCQRGRARERYRWSRLWFRNLRWPRSGRYQDRLAQTAIARRRRPPRLRAAMGKGGLVSGPAISNLNSRSCSISISANPAALRRRSTQIAAELHEGRIWVTETSVAAPSSTSRSKRPKGLVQIFQTARLCHCKQRATDRPGE